MPKEKIKRRKYLVNRKMQMQFVRLLVVQTVVPIAVFAVALYATNKMYLYRLQAIVGNSIISDSEIRGILNFSIYSTSMLILIAALLLAFLGIRFSHNVAGPLYRLERNMDKLAKGEKVEFMHFRKSDTLNGLGDKFNAIAKRFGHMA